MPAEMILRRATAEDAATVCEVYLSSHKTFLPYAPLAHTDEEVQDYIAHTLIEKAEVIVAELDGRILGLLALDRHEGIGWIEQLYLHPSVVGQGIGSQLLGLAKTRLGPPIRLYTFQANKGARRFYERYGFQAIEFGDGSGNEQNCPDVCYEWWGEA